jgi:hypothetical protein
MQGETIEGKRSQSILIFVASVFAQMYTGRKIDDQTM